MILWNKFSESGQTKLKSISVVPFSPDSPVDSVEPHGCVGVDARASGEAWLESHVGMASIESDCEVMGVGWETGLGFGPRMCSFS